MILIELICKYAELRKRELIVFKLKAAVIHVHHVHVPKCRSSHDS
jgi:hypothetical protein